MRIIENEDDGVIGELRYVTVEFSRTELTTGGIGVISQGAVQRYFTAKRPDLKIKACNGIKLDHQKNVVTMRVGIANHVGMAFESVSNIFINRKHFTQDEGGNIKRLEPKDTSELHSKNPVGVNPIVLDKSPAYSQDQKLLNPGYDELADKLKHMEEQIAEFKKGAEGRPCLCSKCADSLKPEYDELFEEVRTLSKELDGVRLELSCPETIGMDNEPLYKWAAVVICAKLQLQAKYDALVIAHDKLLEEYKVVDANLAKLLREKREASIDVDLGPDIGNKELKDIAEANAEEPRIKPIL